MSGNIPYLFQSNKTPFPEKTCDFDKNDIYHI